jgi:hypothetical protein
MNFMRDENGVPHPSTCGIFKTTKKCTCRDEAALQADRDMVVAAAQIGEEITRRG